MLLHDQVYIKSEADLPPDGEYWVKTRHNFSMRLWSMNHKDAQNVSAWLHMITFYFKPLKRSDFQRRRSNEN